MAGNYRLANYLKSLRENEGWKLKEVEAKTKQIDPKGKGVDYTSISRMENAKQDPENPEILKLLSTVYKVPLEEMLKAAGRLGTQETEVCPELAQFNELLKQMSPAKREEFLNFGKYLNEQTKRGE